MHTNKTDTSTPRSTPEPIRERFTREWERMKTSARGTFKKLTDEDVAAVNGRYDEMSRRIGQRYGYSQDRIDTEIGRFLTTDNAPQQGSPLVGTGPSPVGGAVGRDGLPLPGKH